MHLLVGYTLLLFCMVLVLILIANATKDPYGLGALVAPLLIFFVVVIILLFLYGIMSIMMLLFG